MNDLWLAIGELASTLHLDRVDAIADEISALSNASEFSKTRDSFGPNVDEDRIDALASAWGSSSGVTPREVAAALRSAARAAHFIESSEAVELVWTGPKTGLIPTRSTEQVILEVIDSAQEDIFLVSYVFYRATSIIDAVNRAVARGVDVRVLLESSQEHGGTVKGDGVSAMSEAVPGVTIYIWAPEARRPEGNALSAAVHAKCAVADHELAFITSANLTSAAMERNMELGLLIRGGFIPGRLQSHLEALVSTKVVSKWD